MIRSMVSESVVARKTKALDDCFEMMAGAFISSIAILVESAPKISRLTL